MSNYNEWQPIETAPKKGFIIGLNFPHKKLFMARWYLDSWIGYGCENLDYQPTHWIYLPEPPETK